MNEASSTDSVRWQLPPSASLHIELPTSALQQLRRVAEARDTTCEALARLYVGRGLRDDMRRLFEEQVLAVTEEILAAHLGSADEARAIVAEVRERFTS